MLRIAASIFAYMGLLICLAVASPGIGPLGHILLVLPAALLDWLHAPAYGFLAWLAFVVLARRGWPLPHTLIVGSFFALIFGLWTEVLQGPVTGRGTEIGDLVMDGLGIAAAADLARRRSVCRPLSEAIGAAIPLVGVPHR
jgi:hypothetical protein